AGDGVAEPDHVRGLVPAVRARERALPARGVEHLAAAGLRCAGVVVAEGVPRVDGGPAVRVREHEPVGETVVGAVLVAEGLAVALGVVVVDEHARAVRRQQPGLRAQVAQRRELARLHLTLEVPCVAELVR
ncbi:hypothetical protein AEA42_08560, partial [Shewanella sp. Sh95]